MDAILKLSKINYAYHSYEGETKALSDISFSVSSGEFTAIVGPSGCGKSTLLSLIAGLLKPEKGEITICGKTLDESTVNVGYMLQHDHLFEWRSVYRNILLGLEIQHKVNAQTRKKADALLEQYGLKNFRNAKPSDLSGGMRQRAALIRTLILEPELLLLDEHTAALDPKTAEKVMRITEKIVKENALTTLMITHNISNAIEYGNKTIVMSQGKLLLTIEGEQRANMTVEKLMKLYSDTAEDELSDKMILQE